MSQGPMILLVACLAACHGNKSEWSTDKALRPALARMDGNHDGKVDADEYAVTSFRAPTFSEVDQNANGSLDLDELEILTLSQDPLIFDGSRPRSPITTTLVPSLYHPDPYEVRLVHETLEFIREEVVARDLKVQVPNLDEIQRAAASRTFDSPESVDILRRLQDACIEVGLVFPQRLNPSSPE